MLEHTQASMGVAASEKIAYPKASFSKDDRTWNSDWSIASASLRQHWACWNQSRCNLFARHGCRRCSNTRTRKELGIPFVWHMVSLGSRTATATYQRRSACCEFHKRSRLCGNYALAEMSDWIMDLARMSPRVVESGW